MSFGSWLISHQNEAESLSVKDQQPETGSLHNKSIT